MKAAPRIIARIWAWLVPFLLGLGTVAAALWSVELLVAHGVVKPYIVPPPSQAFQAFGQIFAEENLAEWFPLTVLGHHFTIFCPVCGERFRLTFFEAFMASAMIAVIGIAVGLVMYRISLLREATETWIAALAAAPIVLMYPLFLVIFGRSVWTIITMGVVAGLPPVILKTIEGLSATRRVLINVGRSFNLSGPQMFTKILFPAALPTIFVGIRLGLIFTLINVVGVEFLVNFGGLGQLVNDLAERGDVPATYAAISLVILVSVCFFVVTEWIERWLTPAS
jgi:ABC-type nitrate/sulfonate/bicarbonate transport system permease component